MSDAVVRTAAGRIVGRAREGSFVFRAVPYALPPVGERTFSQPVPPSAWGGIRDACSPGPTAQGRGFPEGTIPEPSFPGDDFLTVDVYTPDPSPRARLPVLFWIHGGAYIAGSPASPWYDGDAFACEGIVVVVVGYRLGIAGFARVPDAPHNRALLDQLAALRWVQQNILAFGGDPARITIAGQSAGAAAVLLLMGAEGIDELAGGAIACSPVFVQPSLQEARRALEEVAAILCVEPTAAALARFRTEELDAAVWRMREVFGSPAREEGSVGGAVGTIRRIIRSVAFAPVRDEDPRSSIAEAPLRSRLPLLMGSTAHEFVPEVPPETRFADPLSECEELGIPRDVAARYLADHEDASGSLLVGQVLSDLMVRAPLARIAERRANTWLYDFAWRGRGELNPGLAYHCLDLPFAWGNTAAEGAHRATGPVPRALRDDVHSSWCAFVRGEEPGWAPYSSVRTVRRFDSPSSDVLDGYCSARLLGDVRSPSGSHR